MSRTISGITAWLIVFTVVVWVAWDTIAVEIGLPNGGSTESTAIGNWSQHSIVITAALAILFGHLLASGSEPLSWRHAVAAAVAGVVAYVLTRLS